MGGKPQKSKEMKDELLEAREVGELWGRSGGDLKETGGWPVSPNGLGAGIGLDSKGLGVRRSPRAGVSPNGSRREGQRAPPAAGSSYCHAGAR